MFACIGTGFGQAIAVVPDPADANVVIPASIYRSPFADYRPLGEDKSTPWRDANETVGRIGGWRAYAREAADAKKARDATGAVKAEPTASPQPLPPPAAPAPPTHRHGG